MHEGDPILDRLISVHQSKETSKERQQIQELRNSKFIHVPQQDRNEVNLKPLIPFILHVRSIHYC